MDYSKLNKDSANYKVDILKSNYFNTLKSKECNDCVLMENGEKFMLKLTNNNKTRCNVKILFRNKPLGTFRLESWNSFKISKSITGQDLQFDNNKDNTIEVTFLPEKLGMDFSYKKLDGYATPIQVDHANSKCIILRLVDKSKFISISN